MFANRGNVLRIIANVQDPTVHLGMQRLDPTIEHLGKSGEVRDISHGDPGIAQQFCCAARGDQFDAHT